MGTDSKGGILIVDDNERLFNSLAINLKKHGYSADWADNGPTAVKKLAGSPFAAVFLDLALGEESGLDILPRLLNLRPHVPVIMITGVGSFDAAVKATKLGAYDFLPKPLDIDKLIAALREAVRTTANTAGQFPPADATDMPGMIYASLAMRDLCAKARLIADSPLPVLITGESGSGKELMAKYVHYHSNRREQTFLSVNCSAIADSLADSELFGHIKGAFTGAAADRAGVFEQADRGTLHLDEIGDMSPIIQAKILRVLEDARVRRVGANHDLAVDIRLVASTNKDLEACIGKGSFRQDLYYRLNAVHLRLPPLRERDEDIPALLDFFLERFTDKAVEKRFSAKAVETLRQYPWPGNIRELRNLVKICALTTPGKIIELEDIPADFTASARKTRSIRLSDNEKELIQKAIRDADGNKQLAAQMLGISRRTLYNKLERYGLS